MLKQHVLVDLSQFVQAVASFRGNQKTLTTTSLIRTSLHLLDDLPAAREIVFEYFALVAEVSVKNYVNNVNVDPQTGLQVHTKGTSKNIMQTEDDGFGTIQEALQNFVTKGPVAWGPIIATWSLDLVGSLSDKYSKRKMSVAANCNYWLNCSAMRGLLTLISVCFRKLSTADAEACVERLMTAFQRYGISFEWVVARLGGCFPLKVISQLMQSSLKRFAEDQRAVFESEMGILDYLSFAHEKELKTVLREILLEGLDPKKPIDVSIIPFLMVMINGSTIMLQNLVDVFLEMYNDDICAKIVQKAPLWMSNKAFAEMQPSLNNIALHLKSQGATVLITISRMAEQYSWCQDFLEYTMQELELIVLNARLCPLIDDLATEKTKFMLWQSCLSTNLHEQQTAVRLLLLVSTQHSHIYYQTISELLRKSYAENKNGIGAIIRLIGGQSGVVNFPDIKPGLQMVLEEVLLQEQFQHVHMQPIQSTPEVLNTLRNLSNLTKMQKKSSFPYAKSLISALNECLTKILLILEYALTKLLLSINDRVAKPNGTTETYLQRDFLDNAFSRANRNKKVKLEHDQEAKPDIDALPEDESSMTENRTSRQLTLAHTIIELLNLIEAGSKSNTMHTTEVLKLAVLSVKYFFVTLTEKCPVIRSTTVNQAHTLINRQCSARKAARAVCLRELIEGALFYYGFLFGQGDESDIDELEIPSKEMVLLQNQRHCLGPNSNRTVLHAGVIGRGLRPNIASARNQCDPEMQNLLLKALDSCCSDNVYDIEGYSMISLLLVEMVSTDVMYNGLPFPDEEFTKVTMERDLLIRRAFITSPVLWAILGFIATHRPALCFSSVLLRALCATCLHQWRAKNVNKFQQINPNDELLECTKKFLQILAMGQLLPPPLSQLHMIVENFDAPEIALLLKECVWNYLKDQVPSPALFHADANNLHWRNCSSVTIAPQYVDPLRNLMQKKLPKMGHYYYEMFMMLDMNRSSDPLAAAKQNPPTEAETQ